MVWFVLVKGAPKLVYFVLVKELLNFSETAPRYLFDSVLLVHTRNNHAPCILTAVDAKRCYATGRGIQPRGVRVGDDADFKVACQHGLVLIHIRGTCTMVVH